MADRDSEPPRTRPLVGVLAALFVGAVAGATAAISLMKPGAPPAPNQAPTAKAEITALYSPIEAESLPAWKEESIAEALPALRRSCAQLANVAPDKVIGTGVIARPASDWHIACAAVIAVGGGDAALRAALVDVFVPYRVAGGGDDSGERGLFTGYYEADLRAAPEQGGAYQTPIYGPPRNLVTVDVREFLPGATVPNGMPSNLVGRLVESERGQQMKPYYTRAEIDRDGAIAGNADVLFWADDPVAVHILHIQGSGRVTLPDGSMVRIGFAGHNGRAFKGIGSILLEAGVLRPGGASMIAVREWLQTHPDEAADYMNRNNRYIFFRKIEAAEAEDGPIGAQNVSLTPGRSMAVDPRFIPLGAPLWLDTKDPDDLPIQRLVVAQDVGSAITGPVRGDLFWGHGADAFAKAGRMKSAGSYAVFIPKAQAAPPKSQP